MATKPADVQGFMVRPGGTPSRRPLHLFWIVDGSGSMRADGRIQELNFAVREAMPELRRAASENPSVDLLVRAVAFATGASWHVPDPTPVEEFAWPDLRAGGVSDLGAALALVATELRVPPMPERALPPVIVLISDGRPTDDWETGLSALAGTPWGARAVRTAVAIGDDADLEILQRFSGRSDLRPLRASTIESLTSQIRWASTVALGIAVAGEAAGVPVPAALPANHTMPDVWGPE